MLKYGVKNKSHTIVLINQNYIYKNKGGGHFAQDIYEKIIFDKTCTYQG